MSVFVWSMIGIAVWHFTIFVPDRFAGGIVGAFVAAWLGAIASGFLLEGATIPSDNPPGVRHVLYAMPGCLLGLTGCWMVGVRRREQSQPAAGAAARTSGRGLIPRAAMRQHPEVMRTTERRDRLKAMGPSPTAEPIKVLVVDDHEAVRAGLERVLERTSDLHAVAGLADGREILPLLDRERIDVAVLDYDLERGDGLSLCLRLKQRAESPAVVIYSGYAAPGLVFAATVAQADAVVSKAQPVDVLLSTIRRLAAGERLLDPLAPDMLVAAAARLSTEDLPVMALLAHRADTSEIALALGVERTEVARRARRIVGLLGGGRAAAGRPTADDDELIARVRLTRGNTQHPTAGGPKTT